MTDRETYMEVGNLVFAGTDTTSITLMYLFWALARFPDWQDRIRVELDQKLGDAARGPYDHQSIRSLPTLEAVINDGLRLDPTAPGSLPRITPPDGWQYKGYKIPAKTVISKQCYSTHRDATAFEDADAFLPERWFGKGLAVLELKLVLVALLSRYAVRLPPQTSEESMEMRDHFIVLPPSGKCELPFEPLTPCTTSQAR